MTKVTIDRALIEQAVEAFERIDAWFKVRHFVGLVPQEIEIATALRAALAEPAVEPTCKHPLQVHKPTGWVAHKNHYAVPVLFNPYTGEPRDVRDVLSDPQGVLIVPPGKVEMIAASPPPPAEPAQSAMRVVGHCPKTNEPCQSNCGTPCTVKPVPLLSVQELYEILSSRPWADDQWDYERAIEAAVRRKAGL